MEGMMGFNTVAVLYNDHTHRFREDDGRISRDIATAMQSYSIRDREPMAMNFGAGQIVSQAHADYSQIVVVGQNRGRLLSECNDLDWMALDTLADALKRHGYVVKKPKRARKAA